MLIRDDLGLPIVLIMVKFRLRRCFQKVRFSDEKNSTFHLSRTLFLEGPNQEKKFSSFHKHHFSHEKTTGSQLHENQNLFFGFSRN